MMLDVGDGNAIWFEQHGAANGRPAVVLHGGPGQGCSPGMVRGFDLKRYRVVLFDQRGCGQSTPHASEASTDMRFNTTGHLVADMEALREHLGIDRWMLVGGSWGTTLALAYAEAHPARVSAIVLASVTTSTRSESDWLYGGLRRFFPEAWEAFAAHVGASRADDVIARYAGVLERGTDAERLAAARAWCAWEDAALSFEGAGPAYGASGERDMLAMVRICTHYLKHRAWLDDGQLVREASRLAQIPGVLIHGRRDMSCPIDTAFRLARAWPGSKLLALDDAGHLASDSKRRALLDTLDAFAR